MRRWRHLRLPRGKVFGIPLQAAAVPPFIRQAGALRVPARLLPSARRRWGPALPQANQGAAWPSIVTQPRRTRGLKIPRGQVFPAYPPAPSVYPPGFTRQAGALRIPARLLPSARRRWGPALPQANQGTAWASFTRQAGIPAGPRGVRAPRGQLFRTVPAPPPAYLPRVIRPAGAMSSRGLPARRGRSWGPAIPQGNQGQAWASFTRPGGAAVRTLRAVPRGQLLAVVPFQAPNPPAPPVPAGAGGDGEHSLEWKRIWLW